MFRNFRCNASIRSEDGANDRRCRLASSSTEWIGGPPRDPATRTSSPPRLRGIGNGTAYPRRASDPTTLRCGPGSGGKRHRETNLPRARREARAGRAMPATCFPTGEPFVRSLPPPRRESESREARACHLLRCSSRGGALHETGGPSCGQTTPAAAGGTSGRNPPALVLRDADTDSVHRPRAGSFPRNGRLRGQSPSRGQDRNGTRFSERTHSGRRRTAPSRSSSLPQPVTPHIAPAAATLSATLGSRRDPLAVSPQGQVPPVRVDRSSNVDRGHRRAGILPQAVWYKRLPPQEGRR